MDEDKEIIIRNYPKVIFMWPLCLVSFILWITEWILMRSAPEPNAVLANIWMWIFFANLFILEFEVSSGKFFAILGGIVLIILAIFVWGMPSIPDFNIMLYPVFYGFVFVITGIVIGIGFLEARVDYWKLEKNELLHRRGFFGQVKRYPTQGLRYSKDIPDLFEFFLFKAGSITFYFPNVEPVILPTVLNVNRVAKDLDELLSQFRVKMVN